VNLGKIARLMGRAGASLCPYAIAVGLKRPRELQGFLSAVSKAAFAASGCTLQPFDAARMGGPSDAISLPAAIFGNGEVNLGEYAWLARLCRWMGPRSVFEIGTFMGVSTLALAANSPGATIYSLDLPPDHDPSTVALATDRELVVRRGGPRAYAGTTEEQQITELTADSLTFDFRPYERSIDMVFIDGAHEWRWVQSDSENALRIVSPGGLVVWHDYGHRGMAGDVTDYVERLNQRLGNALYRVRQTSLAIYQAPTTPGPV